MPDVILVVAQVTIGVSIGTQYRHEFLTRLLPLLLSSLVTVPFALLVTGLLGAIYVAVLALPVRPCSCRWRPPASPKWR